MDRGVLLTSETSTEGGGRRRGVAEKRQEMSEFGRADRKHGECQKLKLACVVFLLCVARPLFYDVSQRLSKAPFAPLRLRAPHVDSGISLDKQIWAQTQ